MIFEDSKSLRNSNQIISFSVFRARRLVKNRPDSPRKSGAHGVYVFYSLNEILIQFNTRELNITYKIYNAKH